MVSTETIHQLYWYLTPPARKLKLNSRMKKFTSGAHVPVENRSKLDKESAALKMEKMFQ